MPESIIRFLVVCTIAVLGTIMLMYTFALNSETRLIVKQKVLGKVFKKNK